ncbi:hypothetical protein [Vibrio parahaemolyticus]|uniref:hypothetical protein n=1 Tax=Vibrio parahaemolyticus TaxID=670 RepID=UPI000AA1D82E|nr:hypothetical protein [Vibrio parahaemolyticus]
MSIKQSIATLSVILSVSFNALAINHCGKLIETEPTLGVWWNEDAYGRDMLGNFWCGSASKCTAQLTSFIGCDSGRCFADADYTGEECQHGTLDGFCSDSSCSVALPALENSTPDESINNKYDAVPQKGVAWRYSSTIGETVTVAASKRCQGFNYCTNFDIQPYRNDSARQDLRTVIFYLEGGAVWTTEDYKSVTCDTLTAQQQALIPTCSPNWLSPNPDSKPEPEPDNPTHNPDDPTDGDIEDPSVLPDSGSDAVVPELPVDEPSVEYPNTDESTDTAVVSAITGMNKDVNKALNEMNIDINQASADIQNQIIALNSSVVTNTQAIQKQQANDNEIYRKTKSLIQLANADITTAVNKNTNAINGVGDDVEKIAGAMDGIAEDVSGISETLDGIATTDTSGAGTGGTCIEAGNCTGFYESAYPDGLGGLVSGQLNDLKTNVIDDFVNSFGNIDLSNAQRPSFVLPVPFFGDFSFEEHISFDWVFGFVRAVLIMSSIFAARRIIFGG